MMEEVGSHEEGEDEQYTSAAAAAEAGRVDAHVDLSVSDALQEAAQTIVPDSEYMIITLYGESLLCRACHLKMRDD